MYINTGLLLNLDAWAYGFHRKIQIEINAFRKGKRLVLDDYEACVSTGCYVDDTNLICLDQSGILSSKNCCEKFLLVCDNVFDARPPKTTSKYKCGNLIGHCAEQHVINSLMTSLNKDSDMKISAAVRPRTMLFMDNCENCKAIIRTL